MLKVSGPLLEKFDGQSPIARDLNSITKKLAAKDSNLWGAAAAQEASIRLNWVDLPKSSQSLLPLLDDLKNWSISQGHSRIILCGMGGSSLAPEVFGKTYRKPIAILDSTDPEHIKTILEGGLQGAVIVIGSKSGSTIETASQKLFFESELEKAGLAAKNHIVIVTDPGSPLDTSAKASGYRVINADPNVGGRFSALSAFGLVPAALMGIDIKEILESALLATEEFVSQDSSVVKVATILVQETEQLVAFSDAGSNVPGLSDWIEQLIAESTGKNMVGRLPVVIESSGSEISATAPLITFKDGEGDLSITGSLSEQYIFWEWVTALIGRALKVDPFNQPNVTEAKERTGSLLDKWQGKPEFPAPTYEDADLALYNLTDIHSLDEALIKFLAPASGYVAIMAYLNREADSAITEMRELIADKRKRATTFGWGPRFLHSTGQFHKGGQQNGAFIQITGESSIDFQVPTKPYSFQTLFMAQALGDGEALSSRNYPVMRIHLKDRTRGIARLIEAARKI